MYQNGRKFLISQIGFIDFLVAPLYDAWCSFSKTEYTALCIKNIANNRLQWQANSDNPNILKGVSPQDFEKLDQLLDITIPTISFGGRNDRRISHHRRYTYLEADQKKLQIHSEKSIPEEAKTLESKIPREIKASNS